MGVTPPLARRRVTPMPVRVEPFEAIELDLTLLWELPESSPSIARFRTFQTTLTQIGLADVTELGRRGHPRVVGRRGP